MFSKKSFPKRAVVGAFFLPAMLLASGCSKEPDVGYYNAALEEHFDGKAEIEILKSVIKPSGSADLPEWRSELEFEVVTVHPLYEEIEQFSHEGKHVTIVRETFAAGEPVGVRTVTARTQLLNGEELATQFGKMRSLGDIGFQLESWRDPVYVDTSPEGQEFLNVRAERRANKHDVISSFLDENSMFETVFVEDGKQFPARIILQKEQRYEKVVTWALTLFDDGALAISQASVNERLGALEFSYRDMVFIGPQHDKWGASGYPKDNWRLEVKEQDGTQMLVGDNELQGTGFPLRTAELKPIGNAVALREVSKSKVIGKPISVFVDGRNDKDFTALLTIEEMRGDMNGFKFVGKVEYPDSEISYPMKGYLIEDHLVATEDRVLDRQGASEGAQFSVPLTGDKKGWYNWTERGPQMMDSGSVDASYPATVQF